MKRLTLFLLFAVLSFSNAQDLKKLVISTFDTSDSVSNYGLGLATALERSLNLIDNIFVAPVGDSLIYIQKHYKDEDILDKLSSAFDASVLISGQVNNQSTSNNTILVFSGPDFPAGKQIELNLNLNEPDQAVATIVEKIISELQLGISADERSELNAVIAQTPSVPSLGVVSEAALGLPRANLNQLETAKDLDPNSSWVLSEYARALAISGDLEKALEISNLAIAAEPKDLDAQITNALVYTSLADSQKAKLAFEAALALNPNNPTALAGLANIETDPNKAKDLLQKAINIYPRLVDAYISLAELNLSSDPQAALNILRKGSSQVPDSTSLHRKFLTIAVDLGEEAAALSYLKETLANYPVPPVSIYNLATILPFSINEDAIKIVRDGRIQYPGNPILALSEAELLGRRDDFATAEVVLSDALASNPGDTGLAAALATAQAKQGKVTAVANTIYSVRGHNDEADFEIAQIYLEAGDAINAAKLLEQLVSKHSDSATILGLYGIALARKGNKDQGLVYLDRALSLDPNLGFAKRAKQLISEETSLGNGQAPELSPDAKVLYDQGIAAFQNADYQAAVAFFADSRKIQDSGQSAFYQGLSEYHSGNTRAAARSLKRALSDFPNSKLVLNDMSQIQLDLGRFDLAEEYAKKAIAIDSNYADAYLNLGMVYYRTGQYAKALNSWNEAIRIDPENQSFIDELMTDAKSKQ